MPRQLTITQQAPTDGILVLHLEGDLDHETFTSLEQAVGSAPVQKLVLDCRQLGYISSTGLGVLKQITQKLRSAGGDLCIACLSSKLRRIFDLLGFSRLIVIHDSIEVAIAALSSAADPT